MSRYIIANDPYQVVVGWDNPLETFFAQVIDLKIEKINENLEDGEPGQDPVIFWVGAMPGEVISTVNELQDKIKQYADIPKITRQLLKRDYQQRVEPTPMQKKIREIFGDPDF